MSTTTKIKWISSIILAGVLITLGLIGGDWGKVYRVDASINADPNIHLLIPSRVPAGSPDRVIVIDGSIPGGTTLNTAIRFQGNGLDVTLSPIAVYEFGASVNVPQSMLTDPTVYSVQILMSVKNTIPTVPIWPEYDLFSNPVPFTVYHADKFYLPVVSTKP